MQAWVQSNPAQACSPLRFEADAVTNANQTLLYAALAGADIVATPRKSYFSIKVDPM